MRQSYFHILNLDDPMKGEKKIVLPETDETPVSASEKLVREDIQELNRNTEEIRNLGKEIHF